MGYNPSTKNSLHFPDITIIPFFNNFFSIKKYVAIWVIYKLCRLWLQIQGDWPIFPIERKSSAWPYSIYFPLQPLGNRFEKVSLQPLSTSAGDWTQSFIHAKESLSPSHIPSSWFSVPDSYYIAQVEFKLKLPIPICWYYMSHQTQINFLNKHPK